MAWVIVYDMELTLGWVGLAGVAVLVVAVFILASFKDQIRRPGLLLGIPSSMITLSVVGIVPLVLFTPRPTRLPPTAGLRLDSITTTIKSDEGSLIIWIDTDLHNDSSRNYHYVEVYTRYWNRRGEPDQLSDQVIGVPPHSVKHLTMYGDYHGYEWDQPRVSPTAAFYGQ